MAVLTVRNLPSQTKEALRVKAAKSGLSLEQYIRNVLHKAANDEDSCELKIMETAAEYFGETGGVDLELPPRGSNRQAVVFEK